MTTAVTGPVTSAGPVTCLACGRGLPVRTFGPPAKYCSPACRKRAQRAREAGKALTGRPEARVAPQRDTRGQFQAMTPVTAPTAPWPGPAPPRRPARRITPVIPARPSRQVPAELADAPESGDWRRPLLTTAPRGPAYCEWCRLEPLGPDSSPRLFAIAGVFTDGNTDVDLCRPHLDPVERALVAQGRQLNLSYLRTIPRGVPQSAIQGVRKTRLAISS